MRTADSIEEQNAQASSPMQAPEKRYARGKHPNSRKGMKNLLAPWPKGKSANPSGKPGYDVGAYIARQVLELNAEQIYTGLAKAAIGGNAYAFKELCERGYGKLKETVEHSGEVALTQKLLLGMKHASEIIDGHSNSPADSDSRPS